MQIIWFNREKVSIFAPALRTEQYIKAQVHKKKIKKNLSVNFAEKKKVTTFATRFEYNFVTDQIRRSYFIDITFFEIF